MDEFSFNKDEDDEEDDLELPDNEEPDDLEEVLG